MSDIREATDNSGYPVFYRWNGAVEWTWDPDLPLSWWPVDTSIPELFSPDELDVIAALLREHQ